MPSRQSPDIRTSAAARLVVRGNKYRACIFLFLRPKNFSEHKKKRTSKRAGFTPFGHTLSRMHFDPVSYDNHSTESALGSFSAVTKNSARLSTGFTQSLPLAVVIIISFSAFFVKGIFAEKIAANRQELRKNVSQTDRFKVMIV